MQETPYVRESGYAERYRHRRFSEGHGPRTDRLERRALLGLLAGIPARPGPWLDMPSGAGRMSSLLPGPAVQVDRDPAMLATAEPGPRRVCATALALPFADGHFAGALCLRLLQHVPGSAERIHILGELARVTDGPVVVSFFDACSLQHLRRCLRRWTRSKPRSGRTAIGRATLRADLEAAGLKPMRWAALWRFVAEQTLVLTAPLGRRT